MFDVLFPDFKFHDWEFRFSSKANEIALKVYCPDSETKEAAFDVPDLEVLGYRKIFRFY